MLPRAAPIASVAAAARHVATTARPGARASTTVRATSVADATARQELLKAKLRRCEAQQQIEWLQRKRAMSMERLKKMLE